MGRRASNPDTSDEQLDRLRDIYRGLGPGFPAAAAPLFDRGAGPDGGDWCVRVNGRMSRCLSAAELASTDLFVLPSTWEIMRAEIRGLAARRDVVTVTGFMYCRPRGSWEHMRVPLLHVWTMRLGKALRFENLLDGLELRPVERRSRWAA
jgi:hypothetical protein